MRNPREANQFIGEIAKLPGWQKGHKDRYDSLLEGPNRKKLRQRFVLPSLETLTQGAKHGADYRQTDTQNQTEWLTDCFFAFTNSLPSQS